MSEWILQEAFQSLRIEHNISLSSALLRILLAVLLSSIIGCERANKRHSAGLRTFILASLSGCLAMILDLLFMNEEVLRFLFSSRNQIKGLTTAIALWSCVLIGLSAGAGLYFVSVVACFMLYWILSYLPGLEMYLKNRSNHFEIHLELKSRQYLQDFVTTIRRLGLRIDDIELNTAYHGSGLSVYSVTFTIDSKELKKFKTHKEIIEAVSTIDYIYHIEEMR